MPFITLLQLGRKLLRQARNLYTLIFGANAHEIFSFGRPQILGTHYSILPSLAEHALWT
jgi:hypothetical protein